MVLWYVLNNKFFRYDATTPSDDRSNRCEAKTSQTADTEGTGYLDTLARAALTAAPLACKESESSTPQNLWTYYEGMIPNGVTLIPSNIPPVLGQYLPKAGPFPSFHQSLFVTQPNFVVSGSFPPSIPSNFSIYAPVAMAQPQINKLSTLSDVASQYLAGGDNERVKAFPTLSDTPSAHSEEATPQHIPRNNRLSSSQTRSTTAFESISQSTGLRKSSPIPTPQSRIQEKKPVMDDSRVRSLEEALSKIDCCDPHERSNVIPCKCADGKWRMVKSKCVGGAWVVQVPGAAQPSVYLPLQRDRPRGTLDNWLKEQLTSVPKSRPRSTSTPQNTNSPQQRPYVQTPFYNLAVNRRTTIPQPQCSNPTSIMGGDAIKSLLLKKSAA